MAFTRIKTSLLAAALAIACAPAVYADVEQANSALRAAFPAAVKSVTAGPAPSLVEVVTNDNKVLHATADGRFLIVGDVIAVETRENITKARYDDINRVDFNALPLDKAIKIVKGAGRYPVALFSDPDCPYCKRFDDEMEKLTNATVYLFTMPLPMHKDAANKSRKVWCDKDPAAAWDALMSKGTVPKNDGACKNPVSEVMAIADKFGVSGTPTLILANGKKANGMPGAELQALLEATGLPKK